MKLREILTTLIILVFLPALVSGQISQYGIPIQIIKQKSASPNSDLVIMPEVNNQKLQEKYSRQNSDRLKSFHFAHSFEVLLTPQNSGKWYATTAVNVWQLRIRSVGAYSLNLIFDQFQLPENARLFLISAKTGEVKGAYTSANNSESLILAIEPVEGEELTVQYEEPVDVAFPGQLRIAKVAHDFIGIVSDPRIPRGVSGSCNLNVNCDLVNGTENIRDAVCRIIIEGVEICSGTLINNTSLDGTPYLLTAYHCINTEKNAQSTVFLFNFESPYCSSIIGDVTRSLSGSTLKASLNVLDFSLVKLNTIPPYNYRPYLAGWNRKNSAPLYSMSIHHPQGDIKKVATDKDPATTASFNSVGSYLTNGFWQISRWDKGTTEVGSSGGPLFDQNQYLIGTLTGGAATCTLPTNDYFEKFALSWNQRIDSMSRQLKYWLDPINSNLEKLNGMSLYSGKLLCKPVTNFKDNDVHAAIQISSGLTKKGYWTGTNLLGYTNFAEQFKFSKNCEIQGITLGVAKIKSTYANSYIDVQVYGGTDKPEVLLYSEKFDAKKFWNDGMNYLPFKNSVKTTGTFFISYNIAQMNSSDTLAIYMANRTADVTNSFYLKNQSGWSKYNSTNDLGNGSALLMEIVACNIDDPNDVNELKANQAGAQFFPNPLSGSSLLTIQTENQIDCPEETAIFDLLGKQINVAVTQTGQNNLNLNFRGQRPGIYIIHVESGGQTIVGKIAYIP
jgi:lysyl endopeptidase